MSAAAEVQAALVAALTAASGIAGVVSGVFDGAPARAAFPYITIDDGLVFDWSTKTQRGREHRIALTAWDAAGRGTALQALAGAIEAAIEALPRALPSGKIVSLVMVRSRLLRDPAGPWAATVEYRVRTLDN